jgi:hypothetical protein
MNKLNQCLMRQFKTDGNAWECGPLDRVDLVARQQAATCFSGGEPLRSEAANPSAPNNCPK